MPAWASLFSSPGAWGIMCSLLSPSWALVLPSLQPSQGPPAPPDCCMQPKVSRNRDLRRSERRACAIGQQDI
eukprot:1018301-Rhodomonas_salina.1